MADKHWIARLHSIRNRFSAEARREKLKLIEEVQRRPPGSAAQLKSLHASLLFLQAFPDSLRVRARARSLLRTFDKLAAELSLQERERLEDSGILNTPVHYSFSYEVAAWMSRRYPDSARIDWDDFEREEELENILAHMVEPAESDLFDSGKVTAREWLRLASAHAGVGEFDWLLAQLRRRNRLASFWSQMYDAAELPLIWNLSDCDAAITRNTFRSGKIALRTGGMRKTVARPKRAIGEPLAGFTRLSPRLGARMIDVGMAALATRHRETYHFNHANAGEVYLIDLGHGISVAVMGLLPQSRFVLECTMGFLVLANGVPVGYGGSSLLFKQVNTGLNIFPEFRGSEAAFLWVQVMRVFSQLFGCNRFVANPYQIGGDNPEALKSGAFWLYYRLGYRPVEAQVKSLAQREWRAMRAKPGYRTSMKTLKRLSCCDMHLVLPGGRQSEFFPEFFSEVYSELATELISQQPELERDRALDHLARKVAKDLGAAALRGWSSAERKALRDMAPLVAITQPHRWPSTERKQLKALVKAKGGQFELDYARRLARHDRFRQELARRCTAALR